MTSHLPAAYDNIGSSVSSAVPHAVGNLLLNRVPPKNVLQHTNNNVYANTGLKLSTDSQSASRNHNGVNGETNSALHRVQLHADTSAPQRPTGVVGGRNGGDSLQAIRSILTSRNVINTPGDVIGCNGHVTDVLHQSRSVGLECGDAIGRSTTTGANQAAVPEMTAGPTVGGSLEDLLRVAASCGHAEEVFTLLKRGAQATPDEDGLTALHLACARGHCQVIAVLLSAGCDANACDQNGHVPLQRAAAEGHLEVVKQLLQHGVNVNQQDNVNGNSALHEAAWKGFSSTAQALLENGASMLLRNRGGFSALHLACQNGHNQTCRQLLLAGCHPDIRNSYGDTPLHTSARYGHAGVMRILISGDANVSEQNKNGDSALHIAAAMGRRKLTRILLESRVDTDLTNKQDETAMDIATRKEHSDIQALLRDPPRPTVKSSSREATANGVRSHSQHKREKPCSGGSSSRDGSGKRDGDQRKKSARLRFEQRSKSTKKTATPIGWSPYGCFSPADVADFPEPRLETLPKEPLKAGEQYFLDLGGNIRKGPVAEDCACYCAPFFQHVEHKLERDKHELIRHIDVNHGKLDRKITSLEKRTRSQLLGLNEIMRGRLSRERLDCCERNRKTAALARSELDKHQQRHLRGVKDDLTAYLDDKLQRLTVRGTTDRDGNTVTNTNTSTACGGRLTKCRSVELLTDLSEEDDTIEAAARGRSQATKQRHRTLLQPVFPNQSPADINSADTSAAAGGRLRVFQQAENARRSYDPQMTLLRAAASLSELRCRFERDDSADTTTNTAATTPSDANHADAGCCQLTVERHSTTKTAATSSVNFKAPLGGEESHYLSMTRMQPVIAANARQFEALELATTVNSATAAAAAAVAAEDGTGSSDQHNDSGYSTRIYGSSQGPSPALSGVPEDDSRSGGQASVHLAHQSAETAHQIPAQLSHQTHHGLPVLPSYNHFSLHHQHPLIRHPHIQRHPPTMTPAAMQRQALAPRIHQLQSQLSRISEDIGQLPPIGIKSSLV